MPCVAQVADDLLDVGDGLRVDAGERLVEQDQQRVADQAAGDLQAALLAAGQPGGVVLAQVGQAELLQHLVGLLVALGAA